VEESIQTLNEMLLAPSDFDRTLDLQKNNKAVDFETPRYVHLPFPLTKEKISQKEEGRKNNLSKATALFLPPNKTYGWSWSNPNGTGCKKKLVQIALIPISSNLEVDFVLYWSSAIKIDVDGDISVMLPLISFGKSVLYYVHFRSEGQIGLKTKSISITVEPLRVKQFQAKPNQGELHQDKWHQDALVNQSPLDPQPPYIIRNNTDKQCVLKQLHDMVRTNILAVPGYTETYFALFRHDLEPTIQMELIGKGSIGFAEISLKEPQAGGYIIFDKDV
jgi:hypothetical protein